MSRGHTQGFDSNAAQFARLGNPWEGEPMTRKARRRARQGIRPCRPGLPRLVERQSREGDERIAELNFWAGFDQRRGASARTIVPENSPTLAKIEPWTREIAAPARTELNGWQRLERHVVRVRQRHEFRLKQEAAEAAHRASAAYRETERRQLQRRIEALQARLDQI